MRRLLLAFLLLAMPAISQTATVHVDARAHGEAFPSSWNYFGYDEANYTYTPNGRKLIGELAHLGRSPVHIRTHFLLNTGDGHLVLKWGSTNAYTEDAFGKPVYNWSIVDKIFDTFVTQGVVPFVEIGFMPEALSTHATPYAPTWIPGARNQDYFIGWTYPPADYEKWSDLVRHWAEHEVARYGSAQVSKWDWEVWNEPDIGYWHGSSEEYDKLYDYTASALKHVLPAARLGGPASTGPANTKAAAFLRQFLVHCSTGHNSASGTTGSPLDFISFHVKGRPQLAAGHVRMGLSQEIKDFLSGVDIVKSFPPYAKLPIILSEADPEGCAACSARVYPQNAYRNGSLYPAYEAEAWKLLLDLSRSHGVDLHALLTWAFEFENQPYFDGFRSLATNGIDKPVLNLFRMLGKMDGQILEATSSRDVSATTVMPSGVEKPAISAIASRAARKVAVLIWHYQDEDTSGPEASVRLELSGLPLRSAEVQLKHYRIDHDHSNSYTVWLAMKSPQNPSPVQYKSLEQAGQLQLFITSRCAPGLQWFSQPDIFASAARSLAHRTQLVT